jgi:hypothetical protein
MILLIIILVLLFGGGFGYWGHNQYGGYAGPGIGIGTVLAILLVLYLLHII